MTRYRRVPPSAREEARADDRLHELKELGVNPLIHPHAHLAKDGVTVKLYASDEEEDDDSRKTE